MTAGSRPPMWIYLSSDRQRPILKHVLQLQYRRITITIIIITTTALTTRKGDANNFLSRVVYTRCHDAHPDVCACTCDVWHAARDTGLTWNLHVQFRWKFFLAVAVLIFIKCWIINRREQDQKLCPPPTHVCDGPETRERGVVLRTERGDLSLNGLIVLMTK
jgi:hypothetical protein